MLIGGRKPFVAGLHPVVGTGVRPFRSAADALVKAVDGPGQDTVLIEDRRNMDGDPDV